MSRKEKYRVLYGVSLAGLKLIFENFRQCATGVVDILTPVSTTPVAILQPVLLTPAAVVDTGGNFAAGVVDTGGACQGEPPLSTTLAKLVGKYAASDKFAAGVVDTSRNFCRRCR
jgi:hypothetical protein